jgi:hypothetical protein
MLYRNFISRRTAASFSSSSPMTLFNEVGGGFLHPTRVNLQQLQEQNVNNKNTSSNNDTKVILEALENLRSDMKDMDKKISGVEENLRSDMKNMDKKISAVEENQQHLGAEMKKMDDNLRSEMKIMEKKIDAVDTKIDAVNTKIDASKDYRRILGSGITIFLLATGYTVYDRTKDKLEIQHDRSKDKIDVALLKGAVDNTTQIVNGFLSGDAANRQIGRRGGTTSRVKAREDRGEGKSVSKAPDVSKEEELVQHR